MNEVSGADVGFRAPTLDLAWDPPDRRRTLQLILAALWFLDAVLQLQPVMFTRAFGLLILGPTARGNPGVVAHPITDLSRSIGHHSVGADTAFVVVQFLIAFGIAYRPSVRLALAGSVVWSLVVWWLGEGLGGVLAGTASPLTGAPGAVVLYGVLAVLLWPADRGPVPAPFTAARPVGVPVAKVLWVAIWASLGALALFGSATRHSSNLLAAMTAGEPGWLAALNRHTAQVVAGHGSVVAVAAAVVLVAIALGVLLPSGPQRAALAAAALVGVVIWVLGEDFGQIFSGSATDPNSGPLLVLLAVAYWPLARVARGSAARGPLATGPVV
jgi:hypothetical protein